MRGGQARKRRSQHVLGETAHGAEPDKTRDGRSGFGAAADGEGGVIQADQVKRGALAALNDRFAWVLKDAAEVKAAAR